MVRYDGTPWRPCYRLRAIFLLCGTGTFTRRFDAQVVVGFITRPPGKLGPINLDEENYLSGSEACFLPFGDVVISSPVNSMQTNVFGACWSDFAMCLPIVCHPLHKASATI